MNEAVNIYASIGNFEKAVSACRNVLFLTDSYVDRESLKSTKGTRAAGTCEWITQNESYQSWLHSSSRLLWISGGPGKGKTMLSIFLTEELEATTQDTEDAELAFYFCSHQDEKRNTAVAILRGLVYQIVTKRPRLAKHALSYFETPERVQQTLSSLETLWIIFKRLVEDPDLRTMFCVLDGLDECDDDTLRVLVPRIAGAFSSTASLPTAKAFKLVIVSRDIPGLQGCTRVKLDPDNNDKVARDIERFISTRVEELATIEGFDEIRATVHATLLERSKGTFLWVGFVMNELSQKQTCSQVLKAVDDLPSGLPAIYSRMLLRIPSKHRGTSSAILRWVTIASRPLLLQELAAAIDIRPPFPLITPVQAIRDEIALCTPFLKVQELEVILVHQSARDYLLRKEPDGDAVLEEFRIQAEDAHLELARTCFDCVTRSGLQHAKESPLLRYATLHWPEHARCCAARAAELFSFSDPFFQKKSTLREQWWKAYIKTTPSEYRFPSLPLLHMACYLGIAPWVEVMLPRKWGMTWFRKRVDRRTEDGWTALQVAASEGHEGVVKLLLHKGADVNAQGGDYGNALEAASWPGHEAVVKLLLDAGADFNAQGGDYGNALQMASYKGHDAVVKLLLDAGADVNAQGGYYGNALQTASWGGHEAVVRLLLNKDADVNAQGGRYGNALYAASERGHEAVVKLLLDKDADVNAQGGVYGSALQTALYGGHEAVVKLLRDKGADVNAQGGVYGNALQTASWRSHEAVVKLLLDKDADVNAQGGYYGNALQAASWPGHDAVVKLLLDAGADVNAQGGYYGSALQMASYKGHDAVVKLLLDAGADVNAQGGRYGNALQAASYEGHKAVVKLLLDKDADVNAQGGDYGNALQTASWRGHEAVVRLLLNKGADVNAHGGRYGNALYAASWRGHEAVVKLLLDKNADVNAQGGVYGSALQAALYGSHEAVVKLLRDKGVVG
jgi:ankyrin repeat protein